MDLLYFPFQKKALYNCFILLIVKKAKSNKETTTYKNTFSFGLERQTWNINMML